MHRASGWCSLWRGPGTILDPFWGGCGCKGAAVVGKSWIHVGRGTAVLGFAREENVLLAWQVRPCKNLAGDVASWCFPAGHLPKTPLYPAGSCSLHSNETPAPSPVRRQRCWKTPRLCFCADKSVLDCFASSVANCWVEKILFFTLKPVRSTRSEKPLQQGWSWAGADRALRSRTVPSRSRLAGDAVHSDSGDKLRDYEIFPVALAQLGRPARGR